MRDAERGHAALADLDELRLAHDLERRPDDIVGHRRREEQRLARRRQRGDDAPHVGPEAHVHHAVGFVEHEQIDAGQVRVLLPHVVDQASRRGDDDVDAGAQRALLAAHFDAAVDGRARHRRVVREAVDFVFDLDRELARRREHQHAALGRRGLRRRGQQPLQRREHEGAGLAAAGFGAGDEIVPGERERDHRALNRRGSR